MPTGSRAMNSAYMEWVKTQTGAPYNLANSGVKNYPLSGLNVDFESLELSGPGAYGHKPLRSAIGRKCGVSEDCVVTTQGTSMSNYLAMATLLEGGDEVLIEHPGYPLLWEAAEFIGAKTVLFERRPDEDFAIDVPRIEKLITSKTKLLVITNLHNPSCVQIDTETLQQLGGVAQGRGIKVLVDEVYLDLLFDGTPETSFKLGPQFVVTSSLTKVYGLSGLRCGWILAEEDLARRMFRVHDLFGVNNPYLTDQISCVALANLDRIAQWSRELLHGNRALANNFLAATPELRTKPVGAGTVMFPHVEGPVDTFCQTLRERYETVVTPGSFFGAPDRVRIGIGGETSVLAEGLRRIRLALQDMGR